MNKKYKYSYASHKNLTSHKNTNPQSTTLI